MDLNASLVHKSKTDKRGANQTIEFFTYVNNSSYNQFQVRHQICSCRQSIYFKFTVKPNKTPLLNIERQVPIITIFAGEEAIQFLISFFFRSYPQLTLTGFFLYLQGYEMILINEILHKD